MKKKIYIVGAISGIDSWGLRFYDAREALEDDAVTILTPLQYPENLTQREYMRLSVQNVFMADSLYVLKGWENSKGTKAEIALAKSIGTQIVYQ